MAITIETREHGTDFKKILKEIYGKDDDTPVDTDININYKHYEVRDESTFGKRRFIGELYFKDTQNDNDTSKIDEPEKNVELHEYDEYEGSESNPFGFDDPLKTLSIGDEDVIPATKDLSNRSPPASQSLSNSNPFRVQQRQSKLVSPNTTVAQDNKTPTSTKCQSPPVIATHTTQMQSFHGPDSLIPLDNVKELQIDLRNAQRNFRKVCS